ncbi:hypothetical protein [Saccharopolyspora phatthalungensis]|uniref:Uncharacterized protein n=1 Tax=Saccharopolyspora phatthalungensis TaxID=664693 RepID=A0A840QHX6_9PSEU|nr:hypothetical protein [Saccharopolyspora phatthalungensis]MBB5159650.1 hypothetical protein [Saccharopolyspora phatthalungensis]
MATKQRKPASVEGTTVNLPGVTAEFHRPDHYVPTRDDLAGVAETVRGYLPSRQMMLFYGGLGALAALSVIEWPVAAAIGAGVALAQRSGTAST